jgi:hypothetical protein
MLRKRHTVHIFVGMGNGNDEAMGSEESLRMRGLLKLYKYLYANGIIL